MPVSRLAGQVTNGYRVQLVGVRDAAAITVARKLDEIDLDVGRAGLDRQLTSWLTGAVRLTAAASERAGFLSSAYLTQYLLAARVEPAQLVAPQTQAAFGGLEQARRALLWQLGRGAGRERAMATALAYAVREARTAVITSARETLRVGMDAHPRVVGWRQVTSGRTCSRCAAGVGTVHAAAHPLRTHMSCRCTQEPVLSGLREAVQRQAPTVVAP